MAALAAQSRFIQHQRRMSLPIGELPAELFLSALQAMRKLPQERAAALLANCAMAGFGADHGGQGA